MTAHEPGWSATMSNAGQIGLRVDQSTEAGADGYKACTRCVMDTTDPDIQFDAEGICTHCRTFEAETVKGWYPNEAGAQVWQQKLTQIKAEAAGKPYDCILGLSGGVDSSYLALLAKRWGLRPLVLHVDAGWNSELAVSNIEKVVQYCDFDLYTCVVDWTEMRDLQLAYLKSGISNQDVPQDHAFFANLYAYAVRNGIRHVLNGGNIATESIFPSAWHGSAMDSTNLRAIHRKYGSVPLRKYKTLSFVDMYVRFPMIEKLRILRPLNFMSYSKEAAMKELSGLTGWRSYGHKHGESRFTKLFQNYYLPKRFGYDKRRPHLSSLIVSGQMTREEALRELDKPLYNEADLAADVEFFCKKLRITPEEFDAYLKVPTHDFSDFANWQGRLNFLRRVNAMAKRVGFRHGISY